MGLMGILLDYRIDVRFSGNALKMRQIRVVVLLMFEFRQTVQLVIYFSGVVSSVLYQESTEPTPSRQNSTVALSGVAYTSVEVLEFHESGGTGGVKASRLSIDNADISLVRTRT